MLYYPYGETRWLTGTLTTDYGFTGQRNEAGIGLMDYVARFHDPYLARFVSADTIVPEPGNPQDLNRFAYVRNNPLVYVDPSGHMCVCTESGYVCDDPVEQWYWDAWSGEGWTWAEFEAAHRNGVARADAAGYTGPWDRSWAISEGMADSLMGSTEQTPEWMWLQWDLYMGMNADRIVVAAATAELGRGYAAWAAMLPMIPGPDVEGWGPGEVSTGETYSRADLAPSGSNNIGNRGVQLVEEHMPDVEVGQFRTLDGQRIYDGRLRSTGQYVEIKTGTRGVYYHSGQSSSQVAYDATHGNPVWIFVNSPPGGSLATDLGNAANITVQTLNVGW